MLQRMIRADHSCVTDRRDAQWFALFATMVRMGKIQLSRDHHVKDHFLKTRLTNIACKNNCDQYFVLFFNNITSILTACRFYSTSYTCHDLRLYHQIEILNHMNVS